MDVNKESILSEIINQGGEPVLKKHGVPCVSCPMAAMELNTLQIGDVCNIYGLDLDAILKDLNKPKQKK